MHGPEWSAFSPAAKGEGLSSSDGNGSEEQLAIAIEKAMIASAELQGKTFLISPLECAKILSIEMLYIPYIGSQRKQQAGGSTILFGANLPQYFSCAGFVGKALGNPGILNFCQLRRNQWAGGQACINKIASL